jgi:hypothetical protein
MHELSAVEEYIFAFYVLIFIYVVTCIYATSRR